MPSLSFCLTAKVFRNFCPPNSEQYPLQSSWVRNVMYLLGVAEQGQRQNSKSFSATCLFKASLEDMKLWKKKGGGATKFGGIYFYSNTRNVKAEGSLRLTSGS